MICSCCNEDRPLTAALQCHDDVRICNVCAQWLQTKMGAVDVTPILPVHDMTAAIEFYEAAGFDVNAYDDGYAFVSRDEHSTFDLDLADDFDANVNRTTCYLITPHTDEWHATWRAKGFALSDIADQPWGMREFTLTDPSNNKLRVGRSL